MKETVRLKLVLAYQGTDFAGWQLQPEGFGRSVQGCVEEALARLAGTFVRLQGASRTDSGVHALAQTAHVDVPASRVHLPWRRAMNAILPPDVTIISVERAPEGFHARACPAIKTYTYTFWHENGFLLPQRRAFVWPVGPLNFAAMETAAREFLGTHDFASFQNAGTQVANTVRAVDAIVRRETCLPHESVWAVTGGGFLKQMVRNIMGCLVEVGRGKANAQTVRSLLATKDRTLAPQTAPARGLCLESMEFCDSERQPGQIGPDGDHLDERPGEEELGGPGGSVSR